MCVYSSFALLFRRAGSPSSTPNLGPDFPWLRSLPAPRDRVLEAPKTLPTPEQPSAFAEGHLCPLWDFGSRVVNSHLWGEPRDTAVDRYCVTTIYRTGPHGRGEEKVCIWQASFGDAQKKGEKLIGRKGVSHTIPSPSVQCSSSVPGEQVVTQG